MVFGFGKKKQEEQSSQEPVIIRIQDLNSMLETKKQELRNKIMIQSKPLFSEIEQELQAIYKIIEHLRDDTLKVEDIEKILQVIVVRAKNEVIEVISKESKKPISKITTFEDILKNTEESGYKLKKIGDVLGKHSRVIHVFAKKYAEDLKEHLGLVSENHILITKMLGQYSTLETSQALVKNNIFKLEELSQEIKRMQDHASQLEQSQQSLSNISNSIQKQIDTTKSSTEYTKFLDQNKKIAEIRSLDEKLDKKIDDEFSKVSRPLGKYVYVSSLDKPLKSILERLTQKPSEVIATETKESIVTILESCMKGVMSGSVSVKEAEKSVVQITDLISGLDELFKQKKILREQILEIEKNDLGFERKSLESLEKQSLQCRTDFEDATMKIKNIQNETEQKLVQKQKSFSELQSLIQKLGINGELIQ